MMETEKQSFIKDLIANKREIKGLVEKNDNYVNEIKKLKEEGKELTSKLEKRRVKTSLLQVSLVKVKGLSNSLLELKNKLLKGEIVDLESKMEEILEKGIVVGDIDLEVLY